MIADEAEPVRRRSLSRRRVRGRCPSSASASLASRIADASDVRPPSFLLESVLPDVVYQPMYAAGRHSLPKGGNPLLRFIAGFVTQ